MAPKELNFITGNKNKLLEVQAILGSTGVDLKSQSVDLLEIQGTIEEISKDKCRRAADIVCKYVMFNQVKFTKATCRLEALYSSKTRASASTPGTSFPVHMCKSICQFATRSASNLQIGNGL